MLQDEKLSPDTKQELADSILTKYTNLNTDVKRVAFLVCLLLIIYKLTTQEYSASSIYVLMKSLIKALKEGKIPKVVIRGILRKLNKKGIPVDPELVELVNS